MGLSSVFLAAKQSLHKMYILYSLGIQSLEVNLVVLPSQSVFLALFALTVSSVTSLHKNIIWSLEILDNCGPSGHYRGYHNSHHYDV